MAKALGFEGCVQGKIDQLEIPGKLKEVIMSFRALPEMEIERNDVTGPSWERGLDEEDGEDGKPEDEGVMHDLALANIFDLEAHGDGGEGDADGEGSEGDGDGSEGDIEDWGEPDFDFPVMSSSWSGQVVWSEEDGEGEEEELVVGKGEGEEDVP